MGSAAAAVGRPLRSSRRIRAPPACPDSAHPVDGGDICAYAGGDVGRSTLMRSGVNRATSRRGGLGSHPCACRATTKFDPEKYARSCMLITGWVPGAQRSSPGALEMSIGGRETRAVTHGAIVSVPAGVEGNPAGPSNDRHGPLLEVVLVRIAMGVENDRPPRGLEIDGCIYARALAAVAGAGTREGLRGHPKALTRWLEKRAALACHR